MNEVNETAQTKKTLIDLFSNNLKELSIKYTKAIAKNDIGGGLNILKNIEMVIKIIRDIQENENLSVILDDISTVWESLDNSDEVSKAIGGTRNMHTINVLNNHLVACNKIHDMCFKENLYYNENVIATIMERTPDDYLSNYKRAIRMTQFKGKTYQNTINENKLKWGNK